jgi:hypothetical protein
MPFVNSHSLPTGMTLFRQVGFEFYTSQLKYADPNPFKHSVIGINNFSSTGTSGPCITCHIGQAGEFKRHLPLPVDRNGNLLSTVCANCHAGWMTTDILKSKKDGYEAALAVLAKVLKDRGFSYTETYPNFNNTDWVTSGGFGNAVVPGTGGLTAGMYTMGAAFNFNLLWHDYGAYAHNRIYAKRLIFDSIDWIVNGGGGAMTGSFALPAATGELIFTKSNGTAVNYTAEIRTKAVDYLGTSGLRP